MAEAVRVLYLLILKKNLMQLQIKYFGLLAEITNCDQETLEFSKSQVSDLLSLKKSLFKL